MSGRTEIPKVFILIVILIVSLITVYAVFIADSDSFVEELNAGTLTLTPESNIVLLEQDNAYWGAIWQIPNTYILNLLSSQPVTIGIVVFSDLYQEDIEALTNEFYTFDEASSFIGADSKIMEMTEGENQDTDISFANGNEFFYIILYLFNISDEVTIDYQIDVTIQSDIPILEAGLILGVIMILTIGFVLAPQEEPKNAVMKLIKKHAINGIAFLSLAYVTISQWVLPLPVENFVQLLLVFLTIYKSRVLETMLRVKLTKGQHLISSLYISSLFVYSTSQSYHIDLSTDILASNFVIFLTVDFLQPIFWVIFFFYFSESITSKVRNYSDNSLGLVKRILIWVFSGLIILSFELAFQFFILVIDAAEIFLGFGVSLFLVQIIQYSWYAYFIKGITNKLRRNDEKTTSWTNLFKFPDFQDAIFNTRSILQVLIMFYAIVTVFDWALYVEFLLRPESYLAVFNFIYAFGFLILIYLVWALAFRGLEEHDTVHHTHVYQRSFLYVALGYEVAVLAYYGLFIIGLEIIGILIQLGIMLLTLFLVTRSFQSTINQEAQDIENKTLGILTGSIIVINYVLNPGLILFMISLLALIFIPGVVITSIGRILSDISSNNYNSSVFKLLHRTVLIGISLIGFFLYYTTDPLGITQAIGLYGGFVLILFFASVFVSKDSEVTESDYLNLSQAVISMKQIIVLMIFYLIYFYRYIFDVEGLGLDIPYDYYILIAYSLVTTIVLLFLQKKNDVRVTDLNPT